MREMTTLIANTPLTYVYIAITSCRCPELFFVNIASYKAYTPSTIPCPCRSFSQHTCTINSQHI